MAEKTVNYTPEQTAQVVQDYMAGTPVEDIASALGRSVRSIVAKLSREGVYKRKEYTTKTGEKPIAKEELADEIGQRLNLSENDTGSLAKANKLALLAVRDFIIKHS